MMKTRSEKSMELQVYNMQNTDGGYMNDNEKTGIRSSTESLSESVIHKIRFKVWDNGPGLLEDMYTYIYEVYRDGKCVKYAYRGKNRRYCAKIEKVISNSRCQNLYRKIQDAVRQNRWQMTGQYICDGCSYELQITYLDKRKKIIKGDIDCGSIDAILLDFVKMVFGDSEQDEERTGGCRSD
jgi:hypothetical protein